MLVLVNSCAAYSDAWKPFCELFNRYWEDCPFPKRFISSGSGETPGFEFEPINDLGWVFNLKSAVERDRNPTVLVLQEDFFLCQQVDTAWLQACDEWLPGSAYDCCRLYPCPGGDGETVWRNVAKCSPLQPYRISCQATLWKRERLLECCQRVLRRGGSPYDFEIKGTESCGDFNVCAVIRDDEHREQWPFSYLSTAIVRGKWLRGALDWCEKVGVQVDTSRRGITE